MLRNHHSTIEPSKPGSEYSHCGHWPHRRYKCTRLVLSKVPDQRHKALPDPFRSEIDDTDSIGHLIQKNPFLAKQDDVYIVPLGKKLPSQKQSNSLNSAAAEVGYEESDFHRAIHERTIKTNTPIYLTNEALIQKNTSSRDLKCTKLTRFAEAFNHMVT